MLNQSSGHTVSKLPGFLIPAREALILSLLGLAGGRLLRSAKDVALHVPGRGERQRGQGVFGVQLGGPLDCSLGCREVMGLEPVRFQ